MKDYSGIIQDIKDNITENGKGEITGRDLREILLEAIGNVSVDMGELDRRIEAILGGENYDDIINSWAELEQFLSGLDESSNLVELLSYKADKSDVYSRSDINAKLEEYTKTDDLGALALKDEVAMSDITNLEATLDEKLDKEGGEIENNLLVKGELRMGVLFVPTSNGEPSSYRLAIGELGEGADIPSSGEGGLGSVTIMLGDVPYYSDSNGIVRLPAYPTGGGVSGDYLPLSGGVLSGNNDILTINGIDNSYILFNLNMAARASVGYYNNFAFVANETTYARIGIADDGTPQYWLDYTGNTKHTLIHTGNIGSYAPIYNSSGNVLIGTTSDNGAKLQVGGGIHISRENFYGEYDEGIRIEGASSDWCGVFLGTSSERKGYQDSQWYLLKTNTNTLRIGRGVSSTSYLEINEYGKIGVGKTNQVYELDIEGSIRTTTGNVRVHHTNSDMCLELLHTNSSYNWNYIRQVSNGYEWHIGITSGTDGSDWLYRGAYEIRGNGGDNMNGIFVRYNSSNYGKLVVANSSNYETSIGYLNPNYSYYHPVWTVGTSIGDGNVTTFGWFFANTEAKAWLTSSGNFYAKGYQLPTSAPSDPVSGGYYLYVGSLGAGAVIS